MKSFLVRTNCEYSKVIEAETAEEALKIAETIETKAWDKAWAPLEIDETYES